ncbi:ABC transporter permease [Spiractinospora alimapuensis]|uniref:ABC transporter permease n=1 Tax=Spiractinospora alimapuensis TaxID=2820884 RepID=UPI001F491175|nr:ABC transporter permease [Spiractinospora alimapuensis]QVQ50080.1 ABC transporter permease [Spiractinospora alimapuensis]
MPIDTELFFSALRALTPILFAALGGALCERAGVFNISLEGTLLIGCFTAVAGSWFTGSPWLGVLFAMVAGILFSLILAVGTVTLKGNSIVLCVAMNLLALGLTTYLLRTVFGAQGSFTDPNLQGLSRIDIPLVADIPLVGPVVSGHSPLVYLSWVAVVVLAVMLRRHVWGLRLRGVGETPDAAESLGVSVSRYRYAAIMTSGALCGLGGAQLALGNVTLFAENMTAGRGWIAVVAVMLGAAAPVGVFLAGGLFGVAEALGYRLQGLGMPQQAADAAPYLVTLVALFLAARRVRRQAQAATTSTADGGSDPTPEAAAPVGPQRE